MNAFMTKFRFSAYVNSAVGSHGLRAEAFIFTMSDYIASEE